MAILWDYESWWAVELDRPAQSTTWPAEAARRRWHAALLRLGVTADVVHPSPTWSGYRLVLVPSLYLVSDADAARRSRRTCDRRHVVVSYFSGIVDERRHDAARRLPRCVP